MFQTNNNERAHAVTPQFNAYGRYTYATHILALPSLLTSHSCKCWMRQFVPSHVPAILMKPVIKYWDNRMKASCFGFFSIDMFVVSVSVLSTESSYKLVDSCLACLPCYKTKNTCMYTYEHNTIFFLSICTLCMLTTTKYFYANLASINNLSYLESTTKRFVFPNR